MAHITLAGTLLDPTSELAVGDQVRFTHKSTTGETIKSAVSLLTIPPTGDYSIDLQYGLVLVEYKDVRKSQFKNLGVATVNQDNPATSIPELLNALVPVSSAELIEFQAILADCVAAQAAAEAAASLSEAFAGQLTTLEIIASSQIYAADVKLNASGFDASGDGGGGSWVQNGVTGQTPSQSPTQLADNLLNDANGNQWTLVTGQTLNYSGTQWYPAPFGDSGNGGYLFDSNGWVYVSLINDLSQSYTFPTVADFKASTIAFPAGKTIKTRGNITEGLGAGTYIFKTFAQATSDGDFYSSTSKGNIEGVNGVIVLQKVSGRFSASQFGVDGTSNANDSINEFASLPMNIDVDCYFTDIEIPIGADFIGDRFLIGINASGLRPTFAALEATATPDERLVLQQAYRTNTVTFTGSGSLDNTLRINNALLVGESNSDKNLFIKGEVRINDCAIHRVAVSNFQTGSCEGQNLVSTDSPGDGIFCTVGGTFNGEGILTYNSTLKGLYVFKGGSINSKLGEVYRANVEGIFVNGGGNIFLEFGKVWYSVRANLAANYSGNIEFDSGESKFSGSSGIAIESNCSCYAENAIITDNLGWALTTSFGGFIQAKNSTVQRNGVAANLPAVTTLTGGTIVILGATVDNSNSGTSPVIQSKDNGYIMSEPAGGTGKATLVDGDYSPPYGIIGNGLSMINDTETTFSAYPDDSVGINNTRSVTSNRPLVVAVGTSITIASSWVSVDVSGGPVVIDDIQLAAGFICDEIIIQGSGASTVTVQQGGGNIRLAAPKVLNGANDITKLHKIEFLNRWVEIQ